MELRPYQNQTVCDIRTEWAGGARNVCAVLPTGAGKTVVFGHELMEEPGVSFAIAHRQELISQMSMALAMYGAPHRVQADESLIKWIVTLHMRALGCHFYDPHAPCIVVGVRTLLNRAETLKREIDAARLWVIDEVQHLVRGNEWGKAVALFPETCRGLGVTATPIRSDGKGLGRHADGVMDALVVGPSGRDMITAGYLSDYRLFAPLTNLHLDQVPIGSTGDFSEPKLTAEVRKSTITGDVVEQYLKIAAGKIGVTFVTDVQTAADVAASFNAAGVPAEVVHAKTADRVRQAAVDALARGDLKQLVNVDIFGEGTDIPAIEVCSMARPTASYGLYVQQFGRALRPMEGKDHAIIIDHVGNIDRHSARGLPDKPQIWTLDARDRRAAGVRNPDEIPIKTCTKCTAVYEGFHRVCPFCGHVNTPDGRASVEQVEGDLYELDPSVLAAMRGEIKKIDAPTSSVGDKLRYAGAPDIAVMGAMKQHRLRQEAQADLRHTISLWAGAQRATGVPDYESYRVFYKKYGVDVLGAQALGKKAAIELNGRIK